MAQRAKTNLGCAADERRALFEPRFGGRWEFRRGLRKHRQLGETPINPIQAFRNPPDDSQSVLDAEGDDTYGSGVCGWSDSNARLRGRSRFARGSRGDRYSQGRLRRLDAGRVSGRARAGELGLVSSVAAGGMGLGRRAVDCDGRGRRRHQGGELEYRLRPLADGDRRARIAAGLSPRPSHSLYRALHVAFDELRFAIRPIRMPSCSRWCLESQGRPRHDLGADDLHAPA